MPAGDTGGGRGTFVSQGGASVGCNSAGDVLIDPKAGRTVKIAGSDFVPQQTHIAALGATSDLVGVDGAGSNAAPLAGTEARLDAIEAKLDAVIAAIQAAGITAAS